MSEAPLSQPLRYSWNDFIALDEDDLRELIDGELLEVEVPSELHEHIVMRLGFFLTGWARASDGGRVLASGYKLRVSDSRGVMPDIQYFSSESARSVGSAGLTQGHPDLVIEVLSESSRRFDRVTKLGWYAELGVPEYWIVDPSSCTLERLVLGEGHYVIAQALEGNALFAPPSFDGLEVPLAELWALPG
ncbi:MAG: Uma2 family endonuclease [Deltaproteobacteria bacterium]|nr:Uma2 family endonuclease [Deltaproteobacteria bacterium]